MWKNLKFGNKISLLVILFIIYSVVVAFAYNTMSNKIRDIGVESANEVTLEGYKRLIKDLVDYSAISLGEVGKGITDEKELFKIYDDYIKGGEFFSDKSGYLFVYNNDLVMFAHGTNPALIGEDFTDSADSNGFKPAQGLRDAAESGGGFVEYVWEKAGSGLQPKISYATKIPGTNKFLATGVFINDILEKEEAIKSNIVDFSKDFLIKLLLVLLVIFLLIIVPLTYLMINSIVKPLARLTEAAEDYSRGEFSKDIEGIDRKDEIGTLARSVSRLGKSTQIVMDRLKAI